MDNPYLSCPATSVLPDVYGFSQSSANFGFQYCKGATTTMDVYDNYMVVGGSQSCVETAGQPWPDLEVVACKANDPVCEDEKDFDQSHLGLSKGIVMLYDLQDYSNRKFYVFGSSSKNYHVYPKLLHEKSSHQVMSAAIKNWGLTLSSDEEIQAVGAVLIAQLHDTAQNQLDYLFFRMFAITTHANRSEIKTKWADQIKLSYKTNNSNVFIRSSINLKFVENNVAGSPLNLVAVIAESIQSSNDRVFILNDLESSWNNTRMRILPSTFSPSKYYIHLHNAIITGQGRIVLCGSTFHKNVTYTDGQALLMIYQQKSSTKEPQLQAYYDLDNASNNHYYLDAVTPSKTSDSSLIVVKAINNLQIQAILDFFDGTATNVQAASYSSLKSTQINFLPSKNDLEAQNFLSLDCNGVKCCMLIRASTENQVTGNYEPSYYMIAMTLQSDLHGVLSVDSTKHIHAPFLGHNYLNTSLLGIIQQDDTQPVIYMAFMTNKLAYTRQGSITTALTMPAQSQVFVIASSRSKDCYALLEESDATGQVSAVTASNLEKGTLSFRNDPQAKILTRDYVKSYTQKIYQHRVSSLSTGPMANAKWFGCTPGYLLPSASIWQQQIFLDSAHKSTKVKVATLIGLANAANGQVCRETRPMRSEMRVVATYYGGKANASETTLDYNKTKQIAASSDCEIIVGVLDETECQAHVILSYLLQLQASGTIPNDITFESVVPEFQDSFANTTVKVKEIKLEFGTWQVNLQPAWTVSYMAVGSIKQIQQANSDSVKQEQTKANTTKYVELLLKLTIPSETINSGDQAEENVPNGALQQEISGDESKENVNDKPSFEEILIKQLLGEQKFQNESTYKDLGLDESLTDFERTVAQALRLRDGDTLIEKSQQVINVSDETNLEEKAQFDLGQWVKTNTQINKKSDKLLQEDIPDFILLQELEKVYSIPKVDFFSNAGEFSVKMSSKINVQDLRQSFLGTGSANNVRRALVSDELKVQKLEEIESILKLTSSVQMQLIPGDSIYLDKKHFSWSLQNYDDDGLLFVIKFQNPEFVSDAKLDTLKVTFKNAGLFLQPQSAQLESIPDQFSIVVKLPPQGIDVLTQQELEARKEKGKNIAISQILLSLLLGQVFKHIISLIIVLQILGHLPLSSIYMSANVQQQFKIMVYIVKLDFFEPFNYIEVDFTDMGAWSANFYWLGYDSINFIPGLGSIFILAVLQCFYNMIALAQHLTRSRLPCKWAHGLFSINSAWDSSLLFINGVLFEVILQISVSIPVQNYWKHLTKADKASLCVSFFFLLLIALYIAFLVYFACCKIGQVILINRSMDEQKNLERKTFIHESLIFQRKYQGQTKGNLRRAKTLLKRSVSASQKRLEMAFKLDAKKLKKYEPLLKDLRREKRSAVVSTYLLLNLRRFTMLFLALLFIGHQWVHLQLFILLNVMALYTAFYERPYQKAWFNFLNAFNETICLFVAYVLLAQQDFSREPSQRYQFGFAAVYLLYGAACVNVICLAIVMGRRLIIKAKRLFCRKQKNLSKSLQSKKKDAQKSIKKEEQKVNVQQATVTQQNKVSETEKTPKRMGKKVMAQTSPKSKMTTNNDGELLIQPDLLDQQGGATAISFRKHRNGLTSRASNRVDDSTAPRIDIPDIQSLAAGDYKASEIEICELSLQSIDEQKDTERINHFKRRIKLSSQP